MIRSVTRLRTSRPAAFRVDRFYQALGDTTRLRILNLMSSRELCVCYLVEILAQPQPKISRHLAYLRGAGLVAARRQGTWMHYRIAVPGHAGAGAVLRETLAWMAEDRSMRADRARLSRACCAPGKYAALEGAPLPSTIDLCEAS